MYSKNYIEVNNSERITFSDLPILDQGNFQKTVKDLLKRPECHCVNYFGYRDGKDLKLIMCIANDLKGKIYLFCQIIHEKKLVPSLSKEFFELHIFEREIHENFGVEFFWHPWLKPVRYPANRYDQKSGLNDYPFYSIKSDELHEVGVGPIHAGVIEPGHFRFICNGEMVLHLEIQLGYQHRGIEDLMLNKKTLLQQTILAESIAGDTAIGHTTAFALVMESLADIKVGKRAEIERTIALELERIAIHVGDLSAMCTDVAYQFGSAVFGALRTPIINFTQSWCGNRFGKGLIRVGGSHYQLTNDLLGKLTVILGDFTERFSSISEKTFGLTSVSQRLEGIGKLHKEQIEEIGGVGMVARMAGVKRDIRYSHPNGAYSFIGFHPEIVLSGDVWARGIIRRNEIISSLRIIKDLIWKLKDQNNVDKPILSPKLNRNSLSISLVEGWRGEICHCAITNQNGGLSHYKIKDPSMHNWKALELALRDLEISDFPINNKSFDLSYCGHDL